MQLPHCLSTGPALRSHLHQYPLALPWPLLQLPLKYRAIITDAIGGELEFDAFHRWFNGIFLLSASISTVLFYAQFRRTQQEASDRLPVYFAPPSHQG